MADRTWVQDEIRRYSQQYGLDPSLPLAVAEQESGFNPDAHNPKKVAGQAEGAHGVFQFIPSTASMLGIDHHNPGQNIEGGVRYIKQLWDKHKGNHDAILREFGGVRNDTTYVPQVKARLQKYMQGPDIAQNLGRDLTPSDWPSGAPEDKSLTGRDLTPDSWLAAPPGGGRRAKPTAPAGAPPTMAEQADYLRSGALTRPPEALRTLTGTALRPSTWAPIAGGAVAGAFGGPPAVPIGAAAGSYLGQALENQSLTDVSPITIGLDTAMPVAGEAIVSGAGNLAARAFRPRAVGLAEREAAASKAALEARATGAEAQAGQAGKDIAAEQTRWERPAGAKPLTQVGTELQADVLGRQAAARRAASAEMETAVAPHRTARVGPEPGVDINGRPMPDMRPTFDQLHHRQAALGDQARDAWKAEDYQSWRRLHTQREAELDKMQDFLTERGAADQFATARQHYAEMAQAHRDPAVRKLMNQAHDDMTTFLTEPRAIKKDVGGHFGGHSMSPDEIVQSIKEATSPQVFEEFKNGTRDRIIEASMKGGELDPIKLNTNIKKMGGQFRSLFDAQEQQELQGAAELLKKLRAEMEKQGQLATDLRGQAAKVKPTEIPEVPGLPTTNLQNIKSAMGRATMASAAAYGARNIQGFSSGAVGGTAAAMALGSVLINSPAILKGLMKSQEARQLIMKAARVPFSSPIWDRLASLVVTGAGTTGAHHAFDIPAPPTPTK